MAYQARVFRIFIASPSDVQVERDIAVQVIQQWNDLNSAQRQVVLLPLRWETHTSPVYGDRPQAVINRQIVDDCDLLIGLFWTRLGSSTGEFDSGTIEEIERVAEQGKPIMLYFSNVKQDPDLIEPAQLGALRSFKSKTFPRALVETYGSQIDFRDKFARQLELQVRELLASVGAEGASPSQGPLVTDIKIGLVDLHETPQVATVAYNAASIDVKDYGQIPDLDEGPRKLGLLSLTARSREFYRNAVDYFVETVSIVPLRFWLKNVGVVGARDVYIDLAITASGRKLKVKHARELLEKPSREVAWNSSITRFLDAHSQHSVPQNSGDVWRASIELRALQPQREIVLAPELFIQVAESGSVEIAADIYADTLSKPARQKLLIDVSIERKPMLAREVLIALDIEVPAALSEFEVANDGAPTRAK